jgi:hypothetical protein
MFAFQAQESCSLRLGGRGRRTPSVALDLSLAALDRTHPATSTAATNPHQSPL